MLTCLAWVSERNRSSLIPSVPVFKPGRYEVMTMNGQIMNAAQAQVNEQIVQNRLMTIVYPSGEQERYDLPGVGTTESGKDLRDPKNLYRDFPAVFADFGRVLTRSVGNNPNAVAEGMVTFNDYKQSGEDITFIGDNWTFVLDQYRYCKHIYAMKFLEDDFPTEPSDFPVEVGLMSEWEKQVGPQDTSRTIKGI